MNLGHYASVALVVPGVICGVVLLLAWASREEAADAARGWLGALAVGAAYLFGQAAGFSGVPEFPPIQSADRIFWLAAGAAALACVRSLLGDRRWARLILLWLFSFAVPWVLLENRIERMSAGAVVWTVLGLGGALIVAWSGLAAWSERRAGVTLPLVLAWVSALGGGCLLLTGTAKFAQFAGILVAVLCAAAVVARLRPAFRLGAGPTGVVVVISGCLWIAGVYYSDLPISVAALLAVAPFAACLAELGSLANLPAGRGLLLRLALSGAPALLALFLAWLQRPPPNPYG